MGRGIQWVAAFAAISQAASVPAGAGENVGAIERSDWSWHATMTAQNDLAQQATGSGCPSGLYSPLSGCGQAGHLGMAGVYTTMQSVLEATRDILMKPPSYSLLGHGDGEDQLAGKPIFVETLNCTTSQELLLQAAAAERAPSQDMCWKDSAARYAPGMAGTFFGRNHFYESQWRPNLINRGLAQDVTQCLIANASAACPGSSPTRPGQPVGYPFRLGEPEWHWLLRQHLGSSPLGRVFLRHLELRPRERTRAIRELMNTDCALLEKLYFATREDWPGTDAPAGDTRPAPAHGAACTSPEAKVRTAELYDFLVQRISSDTLQALRRRPIRSTTPCFALHRPGGFVFDPDRDLPQEWRRPGHTLFIAFVGENTPWPGYEVTNANSLRVAHQGSLVFHDSEWWLRHSSKGGYAEVRFKDYVARNPKFVGMNVLAPVIPGR